MFMRAIPKCVIELQTPLNQKAPSTSSGFVASIIRFHSIGLLFHELHVFIVYRLGIVHLYEGCCIGRDVPGLVSRLNGDVGPRSNVIEAFEGGPP